MSVVRALGSVWLGIALLIWIIVYLGLVSVFPGTFARLLHVRPQELYSHPLLLAPALLASANLVIATAMRVRLDLARAGAWISHAGIILLLFGASLYGRLSVEGDALTVRRRAGWTPIEWFYQDDSFAVIVGTGDASGRQVQTPLEMPPADGEQIQGLAEQVATDVPDVTIRATGYLQRARLTPRWESAEQGSPAARLRIEQAPGHTDEIVLTPSQGEQRFTGRNFVLFYVPDAAPRMLTALRQSTTRPGMSHTLLYLYSPEDGPPTLLSAPPDGQTSEHELPAGETVEIPLNGQRLQLTALDYMEHAAIRYEVARAAPDARDARPALRIEVTAPGLERTVWLPFRQYPHLDPPERLELPDGRSLYVSFGRIFRELPGRVRVLETEFRAFPGSNVPRDYRCVVRVSDEQGQHRELLSLNNPIQVGRYQINQGSWLPDPRQPQRIILTVTTRPAIWVVWIGMALTVAGMLWAFYAKPLLLRRRRARQKESRE
ncbi:MAG: hypothetical protein ACOC93_03500 [Planctomycetota bacterium]